MCHFSEVTLSTDLIVRVLFVVSKQKPINITAHSAVHDDDAVCVVRKMRGDS